MARPTAGENPLWGSAVETIFSTRLAGEWQELHDNGVRIRFTDDTCEVIEEKGFEGQLVRLTNQYQALPSGLASVAVRHQGATGTMRGSILHAARLNVDGKTAAEAITEQLKEL